MTARIFISYRTADGMDKATALARELGARFGDEQVFLDKDDLRGGSSWRDEVGRALGARPVLLLLLTPLVFAATDPAGALRIEHPDDPVRREFEAALAAGATIVPVCCDGVEAPPPGLPPPFDRLGDTTWRRLRAYDWKHDVERLVSDLLALGIALPEAQASSGADGALGPGVATAPGRSAAAARPSHAAPGGAAAASASATATGRGAAAAVPSPPLPRRLLVAALASTALGVAAVLGWRAWAPPPTPAGPVAPGGPATPTAPPGLPGTWIATLGSDAPFALTLQQQGDLVAMTSEPMPVDGREGWAGYRDFWLRLTGTPLRDVVYRGRGTVASGPGAALRIDIAWKIFNGAGDTLIDTGNLNAAAAPDGASLVGTLWSNGDRAGRPIVLRRPR